MTNFHPGHKIFMENIYWDLLFTKHGHNPTGNYMIKVNKRNTRTKYEICSNLTIRHYNDATASVSIVKGYLRYKTIFCLKVALDM